MPLTCRLVAVIRLLRVNSWVKNAFVLAGVIFTNNWRNPACLEKAALAFVSFCFISGAVYIINDWLDRDRDRLHPTKRARPLAAGTVSPAAAFAVCGLLFCGSLFLAYQCSDKVLILVMAYAVNNLLYSLFLKHVVILDVFLISFGFIIRLLAGTWGIDIAPSNWMLLCGLMVTLFMGFAKRKAEMIAMESLGADAAAAETAAHSQRRVLSAYSKPLLDTFLSISATATIICYGLYTVDPVTIAIRGSEHLIVTLPLVMFGIYRYLFLLHNGGKGEDPSRELFGDRQLLLCTSVWAIMLIFMNKG